MTCFPSCEISFQRQNVQVVNHGPLPKNDSKSALEKWWLADVPFSFIFRELCSLVLRRVCAIKSILQLLSANTLQHATIALFCDVKKSMSNLLEVFGIHLNYYFSKLFPIPTPRICLRRTQEQFVLMCFLWKSLYTFTVCHCDCKKQVRPKKYHNSQIPALAPRKNTMEKRL